MPVNVSMTLHEKSPSIMAEKLSGVSSTGVKQSPKIRSTHRHIHVPFNRPCLLHSGISLIVVNPAQRSWGLGHC